MPERRWDPDKLDTADLAYVEDVSKYLAELAQKVTDPRIKDTCMELLGWSENEFNERFVDKVAIIVGQVHRILERAKPVFTRQRLSQSERIRFQQDMLAPEEKDLVSQYSIGMLTLPGISKILYDLATVMREKANQFKPDTGVADIADALQEIMLSRLEDQHAGKPANDPRNVENSFWKKRYDRETAIERLEDMGDLLHASGVMVDHGMFYFGHLPYFDKLEEYQKRLIRTQRKSQSGPG